MVYYKTDLLKKEKRAVELKYYGRVQCFLLYKSKQKERSPGMNRRKESDGQKRGVTEKKYNVQ